MILCDPPCLRLQSAWAWLVLRRLSHLLCFRHVVVVNIVVMFVDEGVRGSLSFLDITSMPCSAVTLLWVQPAELSWMWHYLAVVSRAVSPAAARHSHHLSGEMPIVVGAKSWGWWIYCRSALPDAILCSPVELGCQCRGVMEYGNLYSAWSLCCC